MSSGGLDREGSNVYLSKYRRSDGQSTDRGGISKASGLSERRASLYLGALHPARLKSSSSTSLMPSE